MIADVAVITDSAAMLSGELVARFGILVAPLSVTLDGCDYLDGVGLGPEDLYARLAAGARVTTSQPSPGRLLACYRRAAEQGARAVLSLHIGASFSGTVNAARAAAASSPLPVTVVDTGQASFAEGLCVWEACDALAAGASMECAAQRARAAGAAVGNTFVVQALDLVRQGGRLRGPDGEHEGVPVLALHADGVRVEGTAATAEEAVALMAAHVASAAREILPRRLRVGVGHGAAPAIAEALAARVRGITGVDDVVEYVVGPSIGAHLGPGNAGAVFLARPVLP